MSGKHLLIWMDLKFYILIMTCISIRNIAKPFLLSYKLYILKSLGIKEIPNSFKDCINFPMGFRYSYPRHIYNLYSYGFTRTILDRIDSLFVCNPPPMRLYPFNTLPVLRRNHLPSMLIRQKPMKSAQLLNIQEEPYPLRKVIFVEMPNFKAN